MKENMKRAFFSALGILGNYDEAREVSQMAFIKAYRSYDSFDESKKFFTWYYKILRNLCLNRTRDEKREKKVSLLDINEMELERNDTQGYEIEEEKRRLEASLMKLNPEDREIIVLREFENRSYDEIAELLDIPKGSVMSKLYYSRKKLAKIFLENE